MAFNPEPVEIKDIRIKEFHLHMMKPNSKIVTIGKPDTGKSTLIKSIVHAFRHQFPVAMFQNGTEKFTPNYCTYVPEIFVYPELDKKAVARLLRRQEVGAKYLTNPWALLVLDDVAETAQDLRHKMFSHLFKLGRHMYVMLIIALQYALDLPKNVRSCIDYVFIMRETSPEMRETLYKNFAVNMDRDTFNQLMDQITGNHTAMVIVNRSQSNDLEDCVYFYKADPEKLTDFKFGCKEFWDWDKLRRNPNYVDQLLNEEDL